MDDQEALLSTVDHLRWPDAGTLRCELAGHPEGHVCLVAPGGSDLLTLQRTLTARYGQPRNLAMGGYADPTVTARTGRPLLAPFAGRIVEMRAWTDVGRWIGCGTARLDGGACTVVVVAEREEPVRPVPPRPVTWADPGRVRRRRGSGRAADLGGTTTWVDGIVAVTRWDTKRARTIDWPAVEAGIGTALPGDYKRLAETFGHGAFDDLLQLHVPDASYPGGDIVLNTKWLGEWARTDGKSLWKPYEVYPVPGGLLQWAVTETAEEFYWLTEDPDPDRWPVLVRDDTPDSWERFDGTTAEFVYRMLTDPQHPYSAARYYDTHWYESYENLADTGHGSAPS